MLKLESVPKAVNEVLSKPRYLISFIVISFVVFLLFTLMQVYSIPGNSLEFQLSIFTAQDYILLSVLSILTSLLLLMHTYIHMKAKTSSADAGSAAIGSSSGVIAALFATAGCASCLTAVFGFLGVGTVFALVEYQWVIVSVGIAIMAISLYLTSQKLNGVCKTC